MIMENKINVAELLKDCPKGMELYSPLCGKCVFDRLNFGTIICKKQNTQEITFTSKGYYMLPVSDDCECMIFPSKDQRDWSKFVPPYKFKDGDIYYIKDVFGIEFVSIIKKCENNKLYTYVDIGISNNNFYCDASEGLCYCKDIIEHRPATEDEKAKLFQEIKDNGYRWSPETKTLEKLPKFKVGDRIRSIISNSGYIYNVIEVKESLYVVSKNNEYDNKLIDFKIQDYWELVPNKFDITTLVPFESRVLVRDNNQQKWFPAMWGYYDCDSQDYPYKLVGSTTRYRISYEGKDAARYCIPYEGNEHLLGTTDDCDDFYKTW